MKDFLKCALCGLVGVLMLAVAPSGHAAEPAAGSGVGPFTKDGYPISEIDRPLTLPGGMTSMAASLTHARLSVGWLEATSTGLGLGAAYGVNNKLSVGAATAMLLDPDTEWSKSLDVQAYYLLHDSTNLDIALGLSLPLRFAAGADVLGGVVLGADTRLVLNRNVYLFGGNGLLPIAFNPSAMSLNLNAGVGFQATPQVSATIAARFASIALNGEGNETTTVGDFVPADISLQYALRNTMDVVALASFADLANASDFYVLSLVLRLRL